MKATLAYTGRSLWLDPVELGDQFRETCTVVLKEWERPNIDNGFTKKLVFKPQREWWVDHHPTLGRNVFCTHWGFGPRIEQALRVKGIDLEVLTLVDSGLGEPDIDRLKGCQFRGSQPQVLAAIMANRGGQIIAPTGFGKSHIIRLLAKAYPKAEIVVTVPVVEIALELYEALSQESGEIGMVGGGKHRLERVTVAVTHSLKHCNRNCNLLLGDEAHSLVASSFRNTLVKFPRAKLFGFTASPEGRHDNGDKYLEAIFGPPIAEVPYEEAVESGNVVPITALIFRMPHGPNVEHVQRDDIKERMALWANEKRNAFARHLVDYCIGHAKQHYGTSDPQILIMVDKIEHALRLRKYLPEFTLVHGEINDEERLESLTDDGVIQSSDELCTSKQRKQRKDDFSSGELRRVIANKIWSKGVNFPDLHYLIRLDGSGSEIHSIQIPGRLSRLGSDGKKGRGYLVDLIDSFSPSFERRSKKRVDVYRKQGYAIQEIV